MVDVPTVSNAIKHKFIVEFQYKGNHHIVEPHAVGSNGFDIVVLNGNKIDSNIEDDLLPALIYYDLQEITEWNQTEKTFSNVSENYRHNNMTLVTIFYQL